MYSLLEQARSGSRKAGPEDRIEEKSMGIGGRFLPELFSGSNLDEAKVRAGSFGNFNRSIEVYPRVTGSIFYAAQQQHINRSAFAVEQSRDRSAIAAVITAPADHQRAF